jgi:hypothetical protein
VLLAGDAAHIHYPAGGQGLNLGLQDATNLGWKLAAEIRGWAPPGLLDSYHDQRYPIGLDVIDDSLAQCALFANPSREGVALRDRFNEFLGAHPSLCRELAFRLSGLAIRYPAAGELAGQRVPDLDLRDAPAATIFGLLHSAKLVLLSLESAADAPAGFTDRLDIVTARLAGDHPEWAGVRTLLIRPDGYTAWATKADDAPACSGSSRCAASPSAARRTETARPAWEPPPWTASARWGAARTLTMSTSWPRPCRSVPRCLPPSSPSCWHERAAGACCRPGRARQRRARGGASRAVGQRSR